jgi:hypothetical protein
MFAKMINRKTFFFIVDKVYRLPAMQADGLNGFDFKG